MRLLMFMLLVATGCSRRADEWFVESWDDSNSLVTLQHQGRIYKAKCILFWEMQYDTKTPKETAAIGRDEHTCGLIRDYVGRNIPSKSNVPDTDGWVLQMRLDKNDLTLEKTVPTNEHGLDFSRHKEFFCESYRITSVQVEK